MLTREEARKLHEGIEVAILANPSSRPFLEIIQDYIKEMTEKPNAKVKLENIRKAIAVLSVVVSYEHGGISTHPKHLCATCANLEDVNELLEWKDE